MDRASSTVAPLPGLKSTSKKKELYWAHERGLQSEKYVIEFYQSNCFELLGQRVKTPFAEVDLLFRAPEGHVLLVEVKTANIQDFHLYRISLKQRKRLLRALLFLAEKFEALVEAHWAFVTKEGEVTIIEDVSG